jgi:GntR family transcriptional regulator
MTSEEPSSLTGKVEKDSPVPLYFQIERILEKHILNRDWVPGVQIPTETNLCEYFDVSRSVIRQALRNLSNRGLIERTPGKGTFVTIPKLRGSLIRNLAGFHEDTLAQGHIPSTRVLKHEIIPAHPTEASELGITIGQNVLELKRLRFVDGEPHLLSETYLRLDIEPRLSEINYNDISLYMVLDKQFGLHICSGKRVVEATVADQDTAVLLKIQEGAPVLLLRSLTYLQDGRPLEYSVGRHRGDRAKFEVNLVRELPESQTVRQSHPFLRGQPAMQSEEE